MNLIILFFFLSVEKLQSVWLTSDDVIVKSPFQIASINKVISYNNDQSEILPIHRLKAKKIFHVSPFQPIDGQYEFRFDIKNDKIGIWIDLNYQHGGIKTNLIGSRSKLTNLEIVKSIISRPLGSRRVLGLIHWQALKLWFKGARYRARPEPPKIDVSQ